MENNAALKADIGFQPDTIVAFRRFREIRLGRLVEVIHANSAITVDLPAERAEERVSFELVGVPFQDVLKHLGLTFKNK